MARAKGTFILIATLGMLAFAPAARADDSESWATARARSLVEQGQSNRASGHVDIALERFREAIVMDGSYGPAYLALASLREATGDAEEADRVLALGLDRIPEFSEGLEARGDLLSRAGRNGEATTTLLAALAIAPDDVTLLGKILVVAPRAGQLPVALAAARRLRALAHARGDAAAEREAALTATALATLLGEVDPVVAGTSRGERSRKALAAFASGRARAVPPPRRL